MVTADVIVIIVALVSLVLGGFLGFGKSLKFFTSGIFGKIISVVVCYILFGIVLDWPFVSRLLDRFNAYLVAKDNAFCRILIAVRIDMVVFGAALFTIVQLCRVFVVSLIKNVMETDVLVVKIINKALGCVFFTVMIAGLALIAMQVVYYINPDLGVSLHGSFFKLDKIFYDNPLFAIIEGFRH